MASVVGAFQSIWEIWKLKINSLLLGFKEKLD